MGTINEVFIESRSVNISHEPIADLDWPEMTIDFTVTDTVDLTAVPVNEPIHFTLLKNDTGNWVIDSINRVNGGMRK
jgi:Cu(I)/Ag(I) efflux system membrane fusion protein